MTNSTTETRPAPRTMLPMMMAIGPGIVVAGSVMGSGELINTPVQAAKFGFVLLWAVILSCLIKYFLQVEIARHCLVHNRTTIQALNTCPGPKFRGTSWIGLVYMFGYTVSLASLVGIVGAIAGMLHGVVSLADSAITSVMSWAVIVLVITQLLLWKSVYNHLEKLVAVLVGGFGLSVVMGLLLIQGTEYRITAGDVASGLTFSLGPDRKLAAIAVISLIGALGTTANEMFMYPYWVLEKGYGKLVGDPKSDGWLDRAKGWVRIVQLDAGMATLLATVITAAYFLLGAAIFHGRGNPPQGSAIVEGMSEIYTQTYGGWSYGIFLVGAFCTLYSTLIVATAATGRMWSDVLCSMKLIDRDNQKSVQRSHQIVQSIYLLGMLLALFALQAMFGGSSQAETDLVKPEKLVIFGQFFNGLFNTPLLMFGIVYMAFRTDKRLRMRTITALLLLASVFVILACVGYGMAAQSGLIDLLE